METEATEPKPFTLRATMMDEEANECINYEASCGNNENDVGMVIVRAVMATDVIRPVSALAYAIDLFNEFTGYAYESGESIQARVYSDLVDACKNYLDYWSARDIVTTEESSEIAEKEESLPDDEKAAFRLKRNIESFREKILAEKEENAKSD